MKSTGGVKETQAVRAWEVQQNRFPFRAALCKAHPSNTRAALAASPASKHSHSHSDESWRAPDPNAVKANPNSATALQQGPAPYPQGTVLLFPSLQHNKTHLLLPSPSGSQVTAPLPTWPPASAGCSKHHQELLPDGITAYPTLLCSPPHQAQAGAALLCCRHERLWRGRQERGTKQRLTFFLAVNISSLHNT